MGWFNKKGKKEEKSDIPPLPELPKLPELPGKRNSEPIHQLPSFPNNSLGEKFSQNTIKEVVTGEKEGEEVFEADDFGERQMMPRSLIKELPRQVPKEFEKAAKRVKEAEPIFIRIDKFEESLQIIDKTKKQISDIEKMFRDIREIKEDEEKELELWENEIRTAKEQIEKVDKDIFSKVE
jgi:hypothetical protein